MIDERSILLQVATEIANTFMPRGLSPEAAEAEIQRTFACLMDEGPVQEPAAAAYDTETSLLKEASILPVLADWIKQAEAADQRREVAALV